MKPSEAVRGLHDNETKMRESGWALSGRKLQEEQS